MFPIIWCPKSAHGLHNFFFMNRFSVVCLSLAMPHGAPLPFRRNKKRIPVKKTLDRSFYSLYHIDNDRKRYKQWLMESKS